MRAIAMVLRANATFNKIREYIRENGRQQANGVGSHSNNSSHHRKQKTDVVYTENSVTLMSTYIPTDTETFTCDSHA